MDNNEKTELLIKLLGDEKFLARMNDTENDVSKMKALFASRGLELSDDKIEVIIEALGDAKKSMYNGEGLSEQELNAISGGASLYGMAKRAIKAIIITAGAIAAKGALGRVAQTIAQGGDAYGQAALQGARENLEFAGDTVVNVGKNALNSVKTIGENTFNDIRTIVNHFVGDRL